MKKPAGGLNRDGFVIEEGAMTGIPSIIVDLTSGSLLTIRRRSQILHCWAVRS